jgi:hypothetical protein
MKARISTLTILLLLAILTLSGVKEFAAWPQVLELWQAQATPASLASHPHLFRYMVAYPGLLLEEALPGLGFSLYCCVFMVLNASVWSSIVRKTQFASPSYLVWGVFFLVHMFMNGRGVIAWSAWLLCVSLCIDLSRAAVPVKWSMIRGGVACFLGAVSTGVFVIVLFSIVVFLFQRWKAGGVRLRSIKSLLLLLMLIPCGYVFGSYFFVAVEKNLDYYGGGMEGLFHMLGHGMGKIFLSDDGVIIALVLGLPVGSIAALVLFFAPPIRPLRKLLIISIAGGLFGFTVLTLAIPLILCETDKALRRTFRFLGIGQPSVSREQSIRTQD